MLRPTIKWLFLGLVGLVIFGVGGEWLIKVAEEKGLYEDAGKNWDRIMSGLAKRGAIKSARQRIELLDPKVLTAEF